MTPAAVEDVSRVVSFSPVHNARQDIRCVREHLAVRVDCLVPCGEVCLCLVTDELALVVELGLPPLVPLVQLAVQQPHRLVELGGEEAEHLGLFAQLFEPHSDDEFPLLLLDHLPQLLPLLMVHQLSQIVHLIRGSVVGRTRSARSLVKPSDCAYPVSIPLPLLRHLIRIRFQLQQAPPLYPLDAMLNRIPRLLAAVNVCAPTVDHLGHEARVGKAHDLALYRVLFPEALKNVVAVEELVVSREARKRHPQLSDRFVEIPKETKGTCLGLCGASRVEVESTVCVVQELALQPPPHPLPGQLEARPLQHVQPVPPVVQASRVPLYAADPAPLLQVALDDDDVPQVGEVLRLVLRDLTLPHVHPPANHELRTHYAHVGALEVNPSPQ
mmetsp:Transcript_39233/g.95356  ORF Transcript_39233/g.95356 Transcript_39233/m.95356 type:complete len:385 (+) Transcript_39233:1083-2237(+)